MSGHGELGFVRVDAALVFRDIALELHHARAVHETLLQQRLVERDLFLHAGRRRAQRRALPLTRRHFHHQRIELLLHQSQLRIECRAVRGKQRGLACRRFGDTRLREPCAEVGRQRPVVRTAALGVRYGLKRFTHLDLGQRTNHLGQ